MELFENTITSLRDFLESFPYKRVWTEVSLPAWPRGGQRNIVMKEDLGLELGSPDKESVACLIWTENLARISDGRITLVGPDFPESMDQSLPFGKAVLVGVEGFTEDNAYERHRAMDLDRYDLDLEGFMIRAVSQYMKEWCRISRKAIKQGFSARILFCLALKPFHLATVERVFGRVQCLPEAGGIPGIVLLRLRVVQHVDLLGRHVALRKQENFLSRFCIHSHIDHDLRMAGRSSVNEHIAG